MEEVWKDIYFEDKGIIYDYTGLYQISNLGRIKVLTREYLIYNALIKKENIRKVREHFLKKANSNGYERVTLCKNGKSKQFSVHRLVAYAFLENPKNFPIVNHINNVKNDNNVNNLEWCDNSHNQKHAYRTGKQKPRLGAENVLSKKVLQYDKNMNLIKEYSCLQETEKYGFYWKSVGRACRKERKTYKKYIWRYKDEL